MFCLVTICSLARRPFRLVLHHKLDRVHRLRAHLLQGVAESPKLQPAADSRWTQSATESPAPLSPAQNAWSQPAADSRWTQSATESPAPLSPAQNAWSQPAADSQIGRAHV